MGITRITKCKCDNCGGTIEIGGQLNPKGWIQVDTTYEDSDNTREVVCTQVCLGTLVEYKDRTKYNNIFIEVL